MQRVTWYGRHKRELVALDVSVDHPPSRSNPALAADDPFASGFPVGELPLKLFIAIETLSGRVKQTRHLRVHYELIVSGRYGPIYIFHVYSVCVYTACVEFAHADC